MFARTLDTEQVFGNTYEHPFATVPTNTTKAFPHRRNSMNTITAFQIDPLLAPQVSGARLGSAEGTSGRVRAAGGVARTPAPSRRTGVSERIFRRRRRVLGAVLVFGLTTGIYASNAFATDPSADVPPAPRTMVAKPGDTLWGIARQIAPTGDITELVHALVLANGTSLEAGQIVRIP